MRINAGTGATMASMRLSNPQVRWVYLLVFSSGFAGLGYEIVWTRMLAVSLGHEILAVLAVLAAFFVGLAIGAFVFSHRLLQTNQPERWYAFFEIIIGLWGLALIWLIPYFNALMPYWIGEEPSSFSHWSIAFGATLVLLLPATIAMGATLPALERISFHLFGAGRHVGGLYAANTFGAVAGTVLTTFLLAPWLGYAATLIICAAVNIGCAGGILLLFQRKRTDVDLAQTPIDLVHSPAPRLLTYLLLTGFLGLAYEVLMIRALSQVLENTVFTFAIVLCIYLLGTASGAAIYQRWFSHRSFDKTLQTLLVITSSASLLGVLALRISDIFYEWTSTLLMGSMAGAITSEVLLAATVFLMPSIAMGALFSHIAQCASARFGFGRALGTNTFAASLAPFIAGVLLLPAAGINNSLLFVSLGYLFLLIMQPPAWNWGTLRVASPSIVLGVALAALPGLQLIQAPDGGEIIETRDGVMAAVSVVSDASGTRFLKVNNHFSMGSTSSGYADHRQTHLPLLMHGDPQNALFLGIGTGMSLNAAQYYPALKVTAVELVPEIPELMHYFGTDPKQNDWAQSPRLLTSDARRFIASGDTKFDVVIADLFHPSRDGAGSLYTTEHFKAIKQRLTPDGLFCQWLPLFQMDLETFKLIARTFLDQFPYVQVHIPHYSLQQPIVGLVGSLKPLKYESGWLLSKVHSRPLQQELTHLQLDSDLALLGGFLTNEAGLTDFVGKGPLNTDDHPLVTYQAPEFAYRQEQGHAERLVALVESLSPMRGTLLRSVQGAHQHAFSDRMNAYWQARDAYLRAGLGVNPRDEFSTILSKIREPLLDVVRTSEDFSSAYFPLLAMAEALNETDPGAARDLLTDLNNAAPSRKEAGQMLELLTKRLPVNR